MTFTRRSALIAFAGLGFVATAPALAMQMTKFSMPALADAQKAGMPVLVEITAPWCPTCKAQRPILDRLLTSDKYKAFVTLEMDFDTQKDDLRAVKAQMQSTLIVYKGSKEVGRSAGDTNPESIEALLAKAL